MRVLSLGLGMVLLLSGCEFGKVEGTKSVTMDVLVKVQDPEAVKEALQERLVLASNVGDVPLHGARAKVEDGHLRFELDIRLNEKCTPEKAEATKRYVDHLLSQSGTLEVLRISPEGAETLAKALRERHQQSAQTPYDSPGLLVSQASESILVPLLHEIGEGKLQLITSKPGERWVAQLTPSLRGTDLVRTRWEQANQTSHVELVVHENKRTALRELTEAVRGQPLLVRVNGRLLAAPMVGPRITNGRWVFEVPGEPNGVREDLETVAAATVELPLSVTQSEVRCGARGAVAQ